MRQPTIAAIRRIPLKGRETEGALPPHEARQLVDVLRRAKTMKEVDAALAYADVLLEGHGVEALYDESGDDLKALYINMGDLYHETIIADVPAGRFYLTDLATWMQKREKKYRLP